MTISNILQIFSDIFFIFSEKLFPWPNFWLAISDKNDTKIRKLSTTPKVRKILTFQIFKLERRDRFLFREKWKSQGFLEKRSKIILTRRREIFTNPWLFQPFCTRKMCEKRLLFHENHRKTLGFAHFRPKKPVFYPSENCVFASEGAAGDFYAILEVLISCK